MGYIGNQTSNSYTSLDKQVITGDGGASYTLDHAVANENELEVFVNNVRQEPSVAYTVSGTALTMTGNVAASDDFYVVFQGKAIQTTSHPEGHDLQARDGTFSGDVDVDGNVGINEASPDTKLHIKAGSNSVTDWVATFKNSAGSAVAELGAYGYNHNIYHRFYIGDSEKVRILSSGGITFNGDTASANALNDYEEGNWTPSFGAVAAPTYNTQTGHYTKIGNVVYCEGIINVTGLSNTDTSGILIAGLPYTRKTETSNTALFTHNTSASTLFDTAHDNVKGAYVYGTSLYITENNTSSGTNLTYAELGRTSGVLYFACQYLAA